MIGSARAAGGGVLSRLWVNAGVTAVGYFVLSFVGDRMLSGSEIAVLWPAAGFGAVMLLWATGVRGRAVTLAAIAVGYAAYTVGVSSYSGLTFVFLAVNVLEPVIALPFLRLATATDRKLTSLRSLGWLASGAVIACAASATVVVVLQPTVGSTSDATRMWWDVFAGDALGILVVAPFMLQARPVTAIWRRGSVAEQVILWAALALSLLLLARGSSLAVVVLGAVVLIAGRLDSAAASLAILVTSVTMAVLAMSATSVAFADEVVDWADVRLLIAVVVIVGQAVALATTSRVRALGQRDDAVADALDAARRAEESDTALRVALDAGLDAFVIMRDDGGTWAITFANGPARASSGLGPADVADVDVRSVLPVADRTDVEDLLRRAASSAEPVRMTAVLGTAASSLIGTVDVVAARTVDDRVVVTWRDVTEDHAQERKVRAASAAAMHAATHDSLTNLPNRMLFEDRFRHAVGGLDRRDDAVAVIEADIDGFQAIVDRHGDAVADAVLMEVAHRLEALVRSQDTVARVGTDEFEVILTGLSRSWLADDFFDRMAVELGAPIEIPGGTVRVSLSAAYVVVTDPTTSAAAVRHRLAALLKHGRSSGPGRITAYSEDLRLPEMWSPGADDISGALREGEFRLAYQPVIEIANGAVVGQEALIRWMHPRHGLIGPDQFIGVAEAAGLMVDIGDWVLRRAVANRVRRPPGTWTSINVSGAQLVRRDLERDVQRTLESNGLEAGALVLELVESQLLHATPTTLARLESLRSQGVRIALDDFGSGYSSLSYLQDFPIDIVKLDRAMIDGPADERRLRFLRWLAELAPTTGVAMIVEGVETDEQRELALAAGLQHGQGYLWARPGFLDPEPTGEGGDR